MRRVRSKKRRATVSALLIVILSYGDGTPSAGGVCLRKMLREIERASISSRVKMLRFFN